MRASPTRSSKVAVGASGRFIPFDKLPYHAPGGPQPAVAMIFWDSLNALAAAKWFGVLHLPHHF